VTPVVRMAESSKHYGSIKVLDDINLEIPREYLWPSRTEWRGQDYDDEIALNLLQPATGCAEVLGCDSRPLGPEQFVASDMYQRICRCRGT
jgi:hypothetical protein